MPLKSIFIISFFLLSLLLVAQPKNKQALFNGEIQGNIINEQKEPIAGASVHFFTEGDSMSVKEVVTGKDGYFRVAVPLGKYELIFQSLGYEKRRLSTELTRAKPKEKLEQITLYKKEIELKEVLIEGSGSVIKLNGDTIEYNAVSFKPEESDVLKDLIERVPGMLIDDKGNVTVDGKPIRKILVDGREFFGNNIKLALEKLPATMIKKLQVYKQQSETSKFTGYKDRNAQQVLNLVIKEEAKHSVYGDINGGYGSRERYKVGANVFSMQDKNQYSLVGNINNVDMPFSGANDQKQAAITYNPTFKNASIQSNAAYTDKNTTTDILTDMFYPALSRNSQQQDINSKHSDLFTGGVKLDWNPDSLTTVGFRTSFNTEKTNEKRKFAQISFESEKDTTKEDRNSWENNVNYKLTNTFEMARKIGKKGQSISLNIGNTIDQTDGYGANTSEVSYAGIPSVKTIDQKTKNKQDNQNYTGELHYFTPIGKDKILNIGYNFTQERRRQESDIRKQDDSGNYTVLDSAYARNQKYDAYKHDLSLGLQISGKNATLNLAFDVKPSVVKSKTLTGDMLIDKQLQKTVDYAPALTFERRETDKLPKITFNYSASTAHANVAQLSRDTVIEGLLSKSYGNPNLKTSFENRFILDLEKKLNNHRLSFNFSESFTTNGIVSYEMTDDFGNSVNTYRNINGNHTEQVLISYSLITHLKNGTFILSANQGMWNSRYVGFVNTNKSITDNLSAKSTIQSSYLSKSKNRLKIDQSFIFSKELTQNNLFISQKRSTSSWRFSGGIGRNLPYNFAISTRFTYTSYEGYGSAFQKDQYLWSGSLDRHFLKKKLTVSVSSSDILNSKNDLRKSFYNGINYTEKINFMDGYFMFTARYRFDRRNKK